MTGSTSGSTVGSTSGSTVGSTSGSNVVVDHTGWRVYISSSGGGTTFGPNGTQVDGPHQGDLNPVPVPQVYQGSRFSGAPTLRAPVDTSLYQLVNYTWTFPNGAVKGYGAFSKSQAAAGPNGPGATYSDFTGTPTLSLAQSPDDFPFTTDDLNYSGDTDHVINTFYWGPKSQGSLVIKVSATFDKFVDGNVVDSFQGTDTDTFNVVQTVGLIKIGPSLFGTAGLSDTDDSTVNVTGNNRFWIGLDKNSQTIDPAKGRPVGIQYSASISTPTAGSFTAIQTINYQESRKWADTATPSVHHNEQSGFYVDPNTRLPVTNRDGSLKSLATAPVLDSIAGLGYGFRIDDKLLPPKSPTPDPMPFSTTVTVTGTNLPHTLYGNDSPGRPLPNTNPPLPTWDGGTWTISGKFVITLMYNPDPNADASGAAGGPASSIWVPVGQLTWSYSATAGFFTFLNPSPKWVEQTPSQPPPGAYATTTTFPTWSARMQDTNMSKGFTAFFDVP